MAKNLTVSVEFQGNSNALVKAFNKLTKAQNRLRTGTVATDKSTEKLAKQNKILSERLKQSTMRTQKMRLQMGKLNKTGVATVRSNRLLTNSFATMRSWILLASFGVGLLAGSIIRLARLSGEQRLAEKKLSTALGGTSQALLDQASALQQLTGFGDENIITAQSALAAYIEEEESIKRATKATLDFASAKGMDLATAADLVGKTVGSSTNALSRYGIEVQGVVGSSERLDSALSGLNAKFGGQSEARLDTFIGQLELAGGNLGDVGEDIGAELVPALTEALKSFNKFALKVQTNAHVFNKVMIAFKGLGIAVLFLLNPFAKLRGVVVLTANAFSKLGKFLFGSKGISSGIKATGTAISKFTSRAVKAFSGKGNITGKVRKVNQSLRILDRTTLKSGLQTTAAGAIIANYAVKWTGLTDNLKAWIGWQEPAAKLTKEEIENKKKAARENEVLTKAEASLFKVREKLAEQTFLRASGTQLEEKSRKVLVDTLKKFNQETQNQIKLEEVLAAGSLENYLKQLSVAPEVIAKWVELAGVIKKTNENASVGFITTGEAVLKGTDLIANFGQTLSDLEPQSKSAAKIAVRLSQIRAIANAYGAANFWKDKGRMGLAALELASGLANAAAIGKQLNQVDSAATGADFITQGRQMLMVGDNESGREHVQVTPLGNNSRASVGGNSRSVNVNISGNVLGTEEFVRDTLIPEIENTIERNLA
jgi:hypothetical protein